MEKRENRIRSVTEGDLLNNMTTEFPQSLIHFELNSVKRKWSIQANFVFADLPETKSFILPLLNMNVVFFSLMQYI